MALVALRLGIGWHFFQEGKKKLLDPDFSSAGFFRGAKGPLAASYKSKIPDLWGRERLALGKDAIAAAESTKEQYTGFRERVERYYGLNKDEAAESQEMLDRGLETLDGFFRSKKDERTNYEQIETYFRELDRLESDQKVPPEKRPPNEQRRMQLKEAELAGKVAPWLKAVDQIREGFEADLVALGERSLRDRDLNPARYKRLTFLDYKHTKMDRVVTWVTLLVGIGLILGLFTRISAILGAVFLLGVMGTQWPWAAGAEPIYNQSVEFLALLVIAAVGAGRWAGLDFLLRAAFVRCCPNCCLGKTNESKG